MSIKHVAILGSGGWGTALALLLNSRGRTVTLWCRREETAHAMRAAGENVPYLPGIRLPANLSIVAGRPFPAADAYVCAVPTQHIRATFTGLRLMDDTPVLSVAKGIEMGSLDRPSVILREILGHPRVTVLSGPSHAEEVARGQPCIVVAANRHEEHAVLWQKLLSGDAFRVYTSNDPIGVELAGALKNVIAIAAGIGDGLNLGDNAKAALIARGIVEMARLGVALGARKQTFFGISGIGDLVTTCTSPHGRNLRVGRAVGAGRTLRDILTDMKMVAEGIWTAAAAKKLAAKHKVDLPICEQVHAILHEGKSAREALKSLFARALRSETEDLA